MPEKRRGDALLLIEEAIKDRIVLSITYTAANGNRSERNIEPLALYFTQDRWTIVAYCRLRNAWREFRLHAIVDIKKTAETFPPNQFELSDYFGKQ